MKKFVYLFILLCSIVLIYRLWLYYIDGVYMGKIVHEFENNDLIEQANANIGQDLSEYALLNTALLVLKAGEGSLKLKYYFNGDQDQVEYKDVDDFLKKALLISIYRLNLDSSYYDKSMDSCWDSNKANTCVFYSQSWDKAFSSFLVDTNLKTVWELRASATLFLRQPDYTYPYFIFACTRSRQYSPEMVNVISKIITDGSFTANNDKIIECVSSGALSELLEKNRNEPISKLADQFDFLSNAADSKITVSLLNSSQSALQLSKDRRLALAMAIIRMRMRISDIPTNSFTLPSGENVQFFTQLPNKHLKISIGGMGELTMSLKSGIKNMIYFKILPTGENNENLKAIMPESGSYFSPELYRLLMSYFSELAYINIFSDMTPKK